MSCTFPGAQYARNYRQPSWKRVFAKPHKPEVGTKKDNRGNSKNEAGMFRNPHLCRKLHEFSVGHALQGFRTEVRPEKPSPRKIITDSSYFNSVLIFFGSDFELI